MGLDFMTQDLLKDTVYTYNGHKVIIGKVGESNSWCTSENIIHAGSYYKNSVLRLQWSLEVSVETAFYDINGKVIHIPQTVSHILRIYYWAHIPLMTSFMIAKRN